MLIAPILAGCLCAISLAAPNLRADSVQLNTLSLEDRIVHVFEPGERVSYIARLSVPDDSDVDSIKLDWHLEDWHGRVDESGGSLDVNNQFLRVSFVPPRRGWYRLTVRLMRSDEELSRQQASFSVAPRVKSRGETFRYGLSTFLRARRGVDFERELQLIDRLGTDIQREDWLWKMIQPEPDVWDFSKYDIVVDALTRIGVEPLPILAYTTQWATTGDPDASNQRAWEGAKPRLDAYVKYVERTVDHYRDQIRYWQIWNEPDIGFWQSTTADYVRLFTAASKAVVRTNAEAKVLNGGFAMSSREPNPNFLDEFFSQVDPSNWHVWAYHDYQTFDQMLSRAERTDAYRQQVDMSGPIWVTEGGLNTHGQAERDREQAVTLAKKLAYAPALGIEAYMWFTLRDGQSGNFGLTEANYQPRPAYTTYQTLIEQLADRSFISTTTGESPLDHIRLVRYGPRSNENPNDVLIIWSDKPDRKTPVRLIGVEGVIHAVDLMGNPVALLRQGDDVFVSISDEPVYIHVDTNDDSDPALQTLLHMPMNIVAQPESTTSPRFTLVNPTDAPMTWAMQFDSNIADVTAPTLDTAREMASGAEQDIRVQLRTLSTDHSHQGILQGRLMHGATQESLAFQVPLTIATPLPRRDGPFTDYRWIASAWEIDLDTRSDIHNLYDAEPAPEMEWHGPDDLSAVVHAAYDEEALYVAIVVTDDVHHQPRLDSALWRHDSVQVAIHRMDAPTLADYLEFGLAVRETGESGGWLSHTPTGATVSTGRLPDNIKLHAERKSSQTRYQFRLPWSVFEEATLPDAGVRLNVIINDDDGKGRKQWAQITGGIGEGKDPSLYRVFTLD